MRSQEAPWQQIRCMGFYTNKFYTQMLGIGEMPLIGKHIPDILPKLYEQIRPNLDRAFAGERLSYEITGAKKENGLQHFYSVTYEPQSRQSLIMHVVIVVIDITAFKQIAGGMVPLV